MTAAASPGPSTAASSSPASHGTDASWYSRPGARSWTTASPAGAVRRFHRQLPGYAPTALTELPTLAVELGVARVFVKDESSRFGLPAFKALGASWAVARVIAERAQLPGDVGSWTLEDLRAGAAAHPLRLVTATDGNHGRALTRMARLVGASALIVVPDVVAPAARDLIASEGAELVVLDADYDAAVLEAARLAARDPQAVLVQDTAWPGYETIPGWIVEGYATLTTEVDDQLGAAGVEGADLVVVPVGVGSLAQAVVTHYRRDDRATDHQHTDDRPAHGAAAHASRAAAVLSVEPDTAACVLTSLLQGRAVSVPTAATVMAGLNCGTPSSLGWPVLAAGLDAATAVSDDQARRAAGDLAAAGVSSGPCGAASLAAARRVLTGSGAEARRTQLGLPGAGGRDAVVVLLSTEGSDSGSSETHVVDPQTHAERQTRTIPQTRTDADPDTETGEVDSGKRPHALEELVVQGPAADCDVEQLTCTLVATNSVNPSLVPGGAGEGQIADLIQAWGQRAGLHTERVTTATGRPSVLIASSPAGAVEGPVLLLCGHLDTVGLGSMDAPLQPRIEGDQLHGRGTYDMKAGLAAALIACREASRTQPPLAGRVLVAAVADEEHASTGATAVLEHLQTTGQHVDAAVVIEPTEEVVAVAHKGFVWTRLDITGLAAHGSRPHLGVDAILAAGPVLVAVRDLDRDLSEHTHPDHPDLGPSLVHASLIQGGTEESTVPDHCAIVLERRTLPGQSTAGVEADYEQMLQRLRSLDPSLQVTQTTLLARDPLATDPSHPLVRDLLAAVVDRGEETADTADRSDRLDGGDGHQPQPQPGSVSYWADSALIAARGIPTVLYGPAGQGAHADVEWVSRTSTHRVSTALTVLARRFCASSTTPPRQVRPGQTASAALPAVPRGDHRDDGSHP